MLYYKDYYCGRCGYRLTVRYTDHNGIRLLISVIGKNVMVFILNPVFLY